MAKPRQTFKGREKFPLLLFLALLASIYLFWVLPARQGPKPVEVNFDRTQTPSSSASKL